MHPEKKHLNSDFNPRSREGSDFTCRLKGSCINISIRAPARGATITSRKEYLRWWISIRAPARGATREHWRQIPTVAYFNPRSREGSDIKPMQKARFYDNFNPRSREGSDCIDVIKFYALRNFNPRSREGSDLD